MDLSHRVPRISHTLKWNRMVVDFRGRRRRDQSLGSGIFLLLFDPDWILSMRVGYHL